MLEGAALGVMSATTTLPSYRVNQKFEEKTIADKI